jgi:hypothetical protein
MSDPANTTIGYAQAADAYWQAGWRGVLPMRRGAKKSPPAIYCDTHRPRSKRAGTMECDDCTHYTGHFGIDPSYPDLLAWSEKYPDGNLCLRVPDGIVGIDVDAYGAKTGAQALAEAEKRWGPLPTGPRSGSRGDDPVSGIRMFRVPPGTRLEAIVSFPELGIGDIEIIQRHHRYVIAWPSIHPEGREYWWRNEKRQLISIPEPDSLPWLPQAWLDGLKIQPRQLNLDATSYDVRQALTDGDPILDVKDRLRDAVKELNLPGQSRHDTTCKHVMALLRLGKNKRPGVARALDTLREVFVATVGPDRDGGADEARDEFDRMITNDNAARELSQAGITDWVGDIPIEEIVTPTDNEAGQTGGNDQERSDESDPPVAGGSRPDDRPRSPLEEIEQGFWESRDSLQAIYTCALARMSPPWAVLAYAAARALTQVRPCVTLPGLIGGPGSLNWFAALVADSSGGKTTSLAAAEHLVPGDLEELNLGSGEGIVKAFDGVEDGRESVMFLVDEIDNLFALRERSASTTLPVLRSAFSGATLGFANAAKDKRRHVRKHTYRMTLVMGAQPEKAGWLLADAGGGTPQRFMWFPAKDARIRRDRPWDVSPLELPSPGEWQYPRVVSLPREAEDLIIDEQVRRQQGAVGALDGHALFCREKFAYALTVLDGRVEMSSEDWELSGVAAAVSLFTRASTIDAVRDAARIEALDRGEMRGLEMAAADEVKKLEEAERVRSALRWALRKIEEAGPEGIKERDLRNSSDSKRTRHWLPAALQIGHSNGLIRQLEGTTRWVKI